ncbi:MAG: PEP-CTERM sorting domain-containing protein [Planctomycetota bacterium]
MRSTRLMMALSLLAGLAVSTTNQASANELTNPGFEIPNFFGWNTFNNTFPSADSPRTGSSGGLVLGPFFDLPNASGIFQDIPATEGAIYEGSIWAINDTSILDGSNQPDIIAGTGNVVSLGLEWVENGATTRVAEEIIFEGSDPNLVLDEFVQGTVVSPPVPAGVDSVRLVLLFVQPPTFDGGLVFFDDASLAVIPEPASLGLAVVGLVALGRRRR